MIKLIVAKDKNNAIGKGNLLLYYIKRDLKRFKQLTEGNVVVMGNNTFKSLPNGALKNRINIVISTKEIESETGEIYVKTIEEAIKKAKEYNNCDIFVIGGASVYKQFIDLNVIDMMYITEIDAETKNADKFFPIIDYNNWKKINEEEFFENGLNFKFIDYIKKI